MKSYQIYVGGWVNGVDYISNPYGTDNEKTATEVFDALDDTITIYDLPIAFICCREEETGEIVNAQSYGTYCFIGDELETGKLHNPYDKNE